MSIVRVVVLLILFLVITTLLLPRLAGAQSASDLQSQISQHNAQIAALQAEIAQYQAQLDTLGKQKDTLQSAISTLAISQKQLGAQISVTQNKIASANLQLQELGSAIVDKEQAIAADQAAIGRALRDLQEGEQTPLLEQMFAADTLGDAWGAVDAASQFTEALGTNIRALASDRVQLSTNRDSVAKTKSDLLSLNTQLSTQKRSVDASKAAQQQLLTQTKNQESSYQKIIAQKQAAEKSFENELASLEDQLNLIVHPGSLPKVGSGVLSWPLSLSFMQNCAARKSVFGNTFCITQYFGNTPFSTANPQVYNGNGHNAIDIGMPVGTPILAAASGSVLGTGNTDLVKGCYSFGKWVMIKHSNGLNTLYAHLSEIDVSKGQAVGVGQTLGLSGMTGYATGPHLHFGVYASEGTQIMTLQSFRGTVTPCANATMPVATKDAYLNPLSYL